MKKYVVKLNETGSEPRKVRIHNNRITYLNPDPGGHLNTDPPDLDPDPEGCPQPWSSLMQKPITCWLCLSLRLCKEDNSSCSQEEAIPLLRLRLPGLRLWLPGH